MDPQSIIIAISIAVLIYYLTDLSPGGIIVPLYIGHFFSQPRILIPFFLLSFLTYGLVLLLERVWVLYGRQRFALAIILSVGLQYAVLLFFPHLIPLTFGAIGLMIPGVFAAELHRQGLLETTLLLLITGGLIHLALGMLGGGWFL